MDRIGRMPTGPGRDTGLSTTRLGVGGTISAEVWVKWNSTVTGTVVTPEGRTTCGLSNSEGTAASVTVLTEGAAPTGAAGADAVAGPDPAASTKERAHTRTGRTMTATSQKE